MSANYLAVNSGEDINKKDSFKPKARTANNADLPAREDSVKRSKVFLCFTVPFLSPLPHLAFLSFCLFLSSFFSRWRTARTASTATMTRTVTAVRTLTVSLRSPRCVHLSCCGVRMTVELFLQLLFRSSCPLRRLILFAFAHFLFCLIF